MHENRSVNILLWSQIAIVGAAMLLAFSTHSILSILLKQIDKGIFINLNEKLWKEVGSFFISIYGLVLFLIIKRPEVLTARHEFRAWKAALIVSILILLGSLLSLFSQLPNIGMGEVITIILDTMMCILFSVLLSNTRRRVNR